MQQMLLNLIVLIFLLSGCAGSSVNLEQNNSDRNIYLIQPGDVVELITFQRDELTGEFTVSPDGTIGVPILGDIRIEGLSRAEAEKFIFESLSQKYDIPSLLLKLKSVQNLTTITVLGAVNKPGTFQVKKSITFMEAVGLAEGFKKEADLSDIRIYSNGKSSSVMSVNLGNLQEEHESIGNLKIFGNDVIFVSPTWSSEILKYFTEIQPIFQTVLILVLVKQNL